MSIVKQGMANSPETVGVTVVICSQNRYDSLSRALLSIGRADRSQADWNIVVVAHSCVDGTAQRLRAGFTGWPLVIIEQHAGPLSAAKNAALDYLARTYEQRFVIMTDDDVTVDPGWITSLCRAGRKWGEHYLYGGAIEPVFPCSGTLAEELMRYGWLASQLFAAKYLKSQEEDTLEPAYGPNMAFWLSSAKGIRFDPTFGPPDYMGEETVFLQDLARAGHAFVNVPSARVYHHLRGEQVTVAWMEYRSRLFGMTLARFQLRYWDDGRRAYRLDRLRKRAYSRTLRSRIIQWLPLVPKRAKLRLHLRSCQSEARWQEYARLVALPVPEATRVTVRQ